MPTEVAEVRPVEGRTANERIGVIDYELRQFGHELAAIKASIEALRKEGRTNWPLILILAGTGFAVLAFIVAAMELPLNGKIDVLSLGLEHQAQEVQNLRDATTKSASADAASVIDRANLNLKAVENTRLIADLGGRLASIQSDFVSRETEVETQIDATAQALAIQFASTHRDLNELQTSVSLLGGKLPPATNDPYIFPNVSNRMSKAVKGQ